MNARRPLGGLPALMILSAGCAGAPPPPPARATVEAEPPLVAAAPPPAPAPKATPAPAAAARPLPAAPAPAPITEPLLPLTRAFVPVRFARTPTGIVHLREGAPAPAEKAGQPPLQLRSIHGRGPRDIWLLTDDQVVIHDDGERIIARYPQVCGWSDRNEAGLGMRPVGIVADRSTVRVLGQSRDIWSRIGTDLTATLTPAGTWKCEVLGLAPALTSSSGDHTWKLAHNLDNDRCGLRAVGGPCAPVPSWAPSFREPPGDAVDSGVHTSNLTMRGLDDGWLVHYDEERRQWLLRYNGVAWSPVAQLDADAQVLDLWADEEGHAWLAVRRGDVYGAPATEILRADAQGIRPLPVPASFAARWVRGTGPRDVWFAGAKGRAYQWDGVRLREGAAPFDADEMWSATGGEVWIVGGGQVAHTAPVREAAR